MIDFNFRDLEVTLKVHSRSKVMTQSKSAMGNIFFHWHLWPTGNGLAATGDFGDFHFHDLEMTLKRSSKVKGSLRILNP